MNSKIINYTLVTLLSGLPVIAAAQAQFTPLVGIPGLNPNASFNEYINALYALAISVAALIAVIKIIIAGVKYMLSDVVTSKGAAKEDIQSALFGLLIIAAAYLILNQINPNLTTSNLLLQKVDPVPSSVAAGNNNGSAPLGSGGGSQTNTGGNNTVVGNAPGGTRPGQLSTPSINNPDWLPQREVPTSFLSENPSRENSSTPCSGAACVRAADNCLAANGRLVPTSETTAVVCSYYRTEQVNCADRQITVNNIEMPVRNCYGELLRCQDRTPEMQETLWREGSITCRVPHTS
jgi:hypothetical protein